LGENIRVGSFVCLDALEYPKDQVEAMLADSRLLEALKRTLSLFGNAKLVTLLLDAIGSEEL
jgi:hypothetical protein